jgi:AmmeMemoRadiSam system protein A
LLEEAAPRVDDRGLLDVARDSVLHGVRFGRALVLQPTEVPEPWREPRATFVTLREPDGGLRGCIGSLEPKRPLASDVAENAFRAAVADPRFPPLRESEVAAIHLHISVLSPLERLGVDSEAALLAALEPGVHGLLLRHHDTCRATFLPAVWESLPEPARFVRELQRKAGAPAGYWTEGTVAFVYTTRSIGDPA